MKIVCLPGDGIGPEVMREARRVLERLPVALELEEHPFGGAAIHTSGDPFSSVPSGCRSSMAPRYARSRVSSRCAASLPSSPTSARRGRARPTS